MNKKVKLDKQKEFPAISIQSLSHDGRGIGVHENKKIFVDGALPTEMVSYRILKKRSNYLAAQVAEVVTRAQERVEPPCPHFGLCGGCSLQHMHTDYQIAFKTDVLLTQLKHFGHVEPDVLLPPLRCNTEGYRRKARLGAKFVFKKDKLLVGFREKSSNYLADLASCSTLHPSIGKKLTELSEFIRALDQYQDIPQVEVAMGETETALVFRCLKPLSPVDQEKLTDFGKTHTFQIYIQPNPPEPIYPLWPSDADLLSYTLPDYGLQLFFQPLDFTQINLEMNRHMIAQAMRLLDLQASDRVLDLFCGIGNFSLPIATQAQTVVGIEGTEAMVTRATANAQHNQLQNATFYAANLALPEPCMPWLQQTYDKVLLDPPRVGAKEMLPYLKQLQASRIVYVSCNPATLARDAHDLVHQLGYRLTTVGIMDMFPHTKHIEAMALFESQ